MMNQYKQQFSNLTSDYLLQRRALGEGLTDEAHQAIEEIFLERGESLPPRPHAPIIAADAGVLIRKPQNFVGLLVGIAGVIVVLVTAEVLKHTLLGLLLGIGGVIYFMWNRFRRSLLITDEQRKHEDNEKQATDDELTEMMKCAAEGDLERIRDLVAYGGQVNAISRSGGTALMFAVRNNHPSVVNFLLNAGANPKIKSKANLTAMDIAKKFGNTEILTRLEQHHEN